MSQVSEIEIGRLFVGKCNVRKDVGDITELIQSVKQVGILEPLIVRPTRTNKYEIVVGNRRYHAATTIGLKKIPCIIKEMSDDEAIIASLTENIQRGDLTEEEIAETFTSLRNLNLKRWTQDAFARNIGKSQQWVSDLLKAYHSMVKLREAGVVTGMKAYPKKEERQRGVAPVEHLEEIEYAVRSEDVKEKLSEEDLDEKRVELAKAVLELPTEDAKRVIDRFKMYPEKPIEEVKEEALARKAGVSLETYLPPRVARELDRVAEEKGLSMEEVLPDIVKKGLEVEVPPKTPEEKEEKILTEVDTGEIWVCPICSKKYRPLHYDPDKTHRFEEVHE